MPLLSSGSSRNGHPPAPGPDSPADHESAIVPAERFDLQEGSQGRRPLCVVLRRLFKGLVKANNRHTKVSLGGHPRDVNQPSLSSGAVMESSAGTFAGASHFVINQPTMIDQSRIVHIKNTLVQGITVLEFLFQEMTQGADLDSSVRWPVPSCYPGTRTKLQTKIHEWFFSDIRNWDLLWLNGPAGVGKSAVAQTVAEYALENDILGAVYFFSRPNKRNKYTEVFITLAYQLGVRFPGYQSLVGAKLAAEPDLLTKAPRIQFRKLITEPLLSLSHERKRVIILDGLDECDDEDNQLEIIELINDLLRSNTSLPIIWIICSRPESHLKRVFARADDAIQCWREFLPIDSEESRSDTEKFIRGRFKEIHKRYGECVEEDASGSWPSQAAVQEIVEKTSGLFVLADTLLKHIEDSETRDPDQRLGEILALLEYSHNTGSRNPMHDLDLFYFRILSNISDDHWSTTRRILVASTFRTHGRRESRHLAVQPLCNLLGITRAKFYAAMRQLHSVIYIPEPSDAAETPLRFFHATFLDYLTDPNRSGRFFIGKLVTERGITVSTAGLQDIALSGLRVLGSTMGLALINEHKEEVRGNEDVSRSLKAALSWPSEDAHANWASAEAAGYHFRPHFFQLLLMLLSQSEVNGAVSGVLRSFDFNTLSFTADDDCERLSYRLNRRNQLRLSSVVRNKSVSEWDQALLSEAAKRYFFNKLMDFNYFPWGGLMLLGDGTNSIVVIMNARSRETDFEYVSLKTPPQVWPVLRRTSISWNDRS